MYVFIAVALGVALILRIIQIVNGPSNTELKKFLESTDSQVKDTYQKKKLAQKLPFIVLLTTSLLGVLYYDNRSDLMGFGAVTLIFFIVFIPLGSILFFGLFQKIYSSYKHFKRFVILAFLPFVFIFLTLFYNGILEYKANAIVQNSKTIEECSKLSNASYYNKWRDCVKRHLNSAEDYQKCKQQKATIHPQGMGENCRR